jgi:peptidyl-dipeptidase Dcp
LPTASDYRTRRRYRARVLRRTFFFTTCATALLSRLSLSLAKGKGSAMTDDPMLAPWIGPHGGFPRFDKITRADFKPAFAKAMDLMRADIDAIAKSAKPATFDNTLGALEDAGRPLGRVGSFFGVFTSTMNDKEMRAIEAEMSPILAAFDDEITQNEALFARIKAVYDARATAKLSPEQLRLVEVVYRSYARKGAALGAADKARLKDINKKLASLFTTFGQNELGDEEKYTLALDESELVGVPDSLRAAMKAAADAKGQKGKFLITNTRSSVEPFLTYASSRSHREKAWRMWISRGDNNDARDNKKVITEVLALRAERAKLLGFPTHAHWIIDDHMAKTPDAAMGLMLKVWKAAVARVREEVADMQQVADVDSGKSKFKIAPWDYRYYAEKVRKAKYDLDQDEVKNYLQLEKLREAMFWAAGQLYGLAFAQVKDVPVVMPDVRVFEVTRAGKHVGLWYFDPYARDGKRSGAWMSEYRQQEKWKDALAPIVSNNSNFVKGNASDPILISWDDATTLFHEFGHALHGLNSNVRYATLAGTNTKRDFVEFPSQLNEHWLATPEVLNKFCVHYKTGKPIPAELVAKIDKARHFNQGFKTVEYLAGALYDLEIHMLGGDSAKALDPGEFEKQTMKKLGMPPEIVMRHRPTHFGHIFSSDSYSAGYYSYIWADTLTADAAEAFVEAKSFYDKPTAKRLYESIMSVGNSIPPEEAFKRFRGRDVDTNALMRDRGFPI